MDHRTAPMTRRRLAAGTIALLVVPRASHASDDNLAGKALARIAAGRPIKPGRVKLTVPELAENGNSVSLSVRVDSPMTPTDHVKSIHIVSEKNPIADVVSFRLSPRAGRATVATNVRLASSQVVTAIAEMSDGTLWSGTADIIVTLAACVDGG